MCLIARPDIECMLYLKSTLHMKQCLSVDNLTNLVWWVCGSYGMLWGSKGHVGVIVSIGKGANVNVSGKHKLNVGNSTYTLHLQELEMASIVDVLHRRDNVVQVLHGESKPHDWQHSNLLYRDNCCYVVSLANHPGVRDT